MNNITVFTETIPMLDEVYVQSAITSVLDSDSALVEFSADGGEIKIPQMTIDGLGAYTRNSINGYADGSVNMKYETVKANFERGRRFAVDQQDNEETAGLAFGSLASQFMREKVAPEVDAFRFAKYAEKAGFTNEGETLAKGEAVLTAIRKAVTALDEAEVDKEDRYLFITPTLLGLVQDLDTTKSKRVLDGFAAIHTVPQSRFYTAIKQLDGKTLGQEKGGYEKDEGASDINFLIIQKRAVMQFEKRLVPKVITPENNPFGDGYILGYRETGVTDVYANKAKGIYLNKTAAV